MCRVGGPRCDEAGTPLNKRREAARRSRDYNAQLARKAEAEGSHVDAQKYLALSQGHSERITRLDTEIAEHEAESAALHDTSRPASPADAAVQPLSGIVAQNRAQGLRKVLDVPLADYAPSAVQDRLRSQEFRNLLDKQRSTGETLDALDGLRAAGEAVSVRDHHRAVDAHRAARADLMDYRMETARQIEGTATTTDASFALPAGVTELGEAESGSAEWLRMRQQTLGGSDVGAICKVGEWGHLNYDDCRASKMDLDPQDQDHEGAAEIGDIWEPHLVSMASDAIGQDAFTNKATVSDGKRHANLDSFTKDEDDSVRTVIEMKTSSRAEEWADHSPDGYALQTQHYIDVVGAKDGLIIANINDERLVAFDVSPTDKVSAGPKSVKKLGSEFSYSDAREYSEGMVQKWNSDREAARNSDGTDKPRRRFQLKDEEKEVWRQGLEKGFVFADLETSHMAPGKGHIIEMGGVDESGKEFQSLYGVPSDHDRWNGTGAVEVHGIDSSMVEGRPVLLEDDASVQEIKDYIGDRVLVAHNASFESRWLNEAGIKTTTADSMRLFGSVVDDDAKDNTMASLTKWAGVEYRDAHRALPDAQMLRESFEKMRPLLEKAVR